MQLIFRLLLAVLLASLIAGCSQSESSSSAGHAVLVVQFAPPAAKLSARAVSSAAPVLPAELTRIVFSVKNENNEVITEGDWLKSDGKLEFGLDAGVPLNLVGTAYAGNEILFSGSAAIAPLVAGEKRPVAILLAPKVKVLVSPSGSTGLVTTQSAVRVTVGSSGGVQLSSNVTGLEDARVVWSVNEIEGGNATVGTISTQGQYTPPAVLPEDTVVIVRAEPVSAPSFASSLPIQLIPVVPPIVVDTLPPTSRATPAGGEYISQVSVALTCGDCTEIFYTTDESEPDLTSQPYHQPLILNADTVLRFVSLDAAGNREVVVHNESYLVETVPAAPTVITASGGSGEVSLSWGASSQARTYNVYRSESADFSVTDVPIKSGLAQPTFLDSSVVNGTTYYYAVLAVNRAGTSALSATRSARPVPGKPAAPTLLTAQAADNLVGLSWQPSAGAATYSIFRSETAGVATGGQSWRFGLESTAYNDATALNGTQYFYAVTANNLGGASAASNEVSAKPMPPLPGTPTVQAAAGIGQVTLSWDTDGKAESYNIYRSSQADVSFTGEPVASILGSATTQFVDTGLEGGKVFYYVVVAINLSGNSLPSAVVTATPTLAPCVWNQGLWNACNWQ